MTAALIPVVKFWMNRPRVTPDLKSLIKKTVGHPIRVMLVLPPRVANMFYVLMVTILFTHKRWKLHIF